VATCHNGWAGRALSTTVIAWSGPATCGRGLHPAIAAPNMGPPPNTTNATSCRKVNLLLQYALISVKISWRIGQQTMSYKPRWLRHSSKAGPDCSAAASVRIRFPTAPERVEGPGHFIDWPEQKTGRQNRFIVLLRHSVVRAIVRTARGVSAPSQRSVVATERGARGTRLDRFA
jgi:hypothetical protein